MDNDTARLLAEKGVITQEDLADLATDDLVEMTGHRRGARQDADHDGARAMVCENTRNALRVNDARRGYSVMQEKSD